MTMELFASNRLWIPPEHELKKEVLNEAYSSTYSIHPGSTKMYKDLKQHFWWNSMKKDVVDHIMKYLTCQQVRVEHQQPVGEL